MAIAVIAIEVTDSVGGVQLYVKISVLKILQ